LKRFIAQYEEKAERQLVRDFFQSPSDLAIYCSRPLDIADMPQVKGQLVYDCIDDFEGFAGNTDGKLLAREEQLCERADYIWVVSRHLQEKLSKYASKVRYVPNGVDYGHFSAAQEIRSRRPVDRNRRKSLIYVGAIYHWFDAALVSEVAAKLPDWDINLIGPAVFYGNMETLLAKPNINLLGTKNYRELPLFLGQADVAMIPFKINRLIQGTSPIKLFEYFAAGLPVVTTMMPEVEPYQERGVAACRESATEFAQAVEDLYLNCDQSRCLDIGKSSGWQERFAGVLSEAGFAVPGQQNQGV
jgi:hypothetical protein